MEIPYQMAHSKALTHQTKGNNYYMYHDSDPDDREWYIIYLSFCLSLTYNRVLNSFLVNSRDEIVDPKTLGLVSRTGLHGTIMVMQTYAK